MKKAGKWKTEGAGALFTRSLVPGPLLGSSSCTASEMFRGIKYILIPKHGAEA